MKPVFLSIFLMLFIAGMVSASLEDCPTCVFAYDDDGLADTNPLAGCPTCMFAYDDDGLADTNPLAGCPTCMFATGIEVRGDCPSCTFSSTIASTDIIYTFVNGTPIPEDYVCPIHGVYCPDDPRPLELRPGYVAPAPTVKPTPQPHFQPQTSTEFISLFKRPGLMPRSDHLEALLKR
jgi:hypothetical protein